MEVQGRAQWRQSSSEKYRVAKVDDMLRHHDEVLEAGGTCIMLSVNSVGLPGVAKVRRHSQLPIHGHRNGWGMLTRCPYLGIDFRAYQKLAAPALGIGDGVEVIARLAPTE